MIPLIDGKYIDQEEKDLIESFEQAIDEGDIQVPSEEKLREIHQIWNQRVKNTQERKAVTLRLQQRDILKIKVEAQKKGIPYQTLIASVIHQYSTGDLVERK